MVRRLQLGGCSRLLLTETDMYSVGNSCLSRVKRRAVPIHAAQRCTCVTAAIVKVSLVTVVTLNRMQTCFQVTFTTHVYVQNGVGASLCATSP